MSQLDLFGRKKPHATCGECQFYSRSTVYYSSGAKTYDLPKSHPCCLRFQFKEEASDA